MRREYDDLLDYLREEFGDGVRFVAVFDEFDYEFLHGEEWFRSFVAERDTRPPEKMHQDARHTFQQAELSGDLYDNEVHAEIMVTEDGIGCYLFLDEEALFVWLAPDVEVGVPSFVTACRERIDVAR